MFSILDMYLIRLKYNTFTKVGNLLEYNLFYLDWVIMAAFGKPVVPDV